MSGGAGQLVMSGPLILAVPVVAAAGAITFASPCCLPLIPGYLSYLTGMSGAGVASTGQDAQEPAGGAAVAAGLARAQGRTVASPRDRAGCSWSRRTERRSGRRGR